MVIFNRFLRFTIIILWAALAECCKSPQQTTNEFKEEKITETIEVDDTTTVIRDKVITSMPTDSGGTKTIIHEEERTITRNRQRASKYNQANQAQQRLDKISPKMEREKTKQIKAQSKADAKVGVAKAKSDAKIAKENRKANQFRFTKRNIGKIIFFCFMAAVLWYWGKKPYY